MIGAVELDEARSGDRLGHLPPDLDRRIAVLSRQWKTSVGARILASSPRTSMRDASSIIGSMFLTGPSVWKCSLCQSISVWLADGK